VEATPRARVPFVFVAKSRQEFLSCGTANSNQMFFDFVTLTGVFFFISPLSKVRAGRV